jgi:steroid delta-isomerase-like uncharacterized protein
MSSSGRLPEAMDAYAAAWNAHDAAAVTSFMTEDVIYEDVPLGRRFQGRAAVQEFVASMANTLSTDYSFELTRSLVDGDRIAGTWTLSGTHDRADEQMGLPATGRHFEVRGVSVGRLLDGRIAENTDYWDMAGFLVQIGLMPAPEGQPAPV